MHFQLVSILQKFCAKYGILLSNLHNYLLVSSKELNLVIKNPKRLDVLFCMKLSKLFNTSIEYWLNIRNTYLISDTKKKLSIDKFKKYEKFKIDYEKITPFRI